MIRPKQRDLFAVIGNPVAHSLSPVMMEAAFVELGIPAVYLALEVDSISEDLDILWNFGFRGLSVTLPFKEAAFLLAQYTEETARRIRAVNTLRRHDDGWEGTNTDWIGSVRALEQVSPLRGKRVLVLGAGGAARAVVYGLIRSGAAVSISNRTPERGEALAQAFRCGFVPLAELEKDHSGESFDVLVQCTSAGLLGDEDPQVVPDSFFLPGMIVMDTIYTPQWTTFLKKARNAGCSTVPGSEMLLHQGAMQLEWWLGREKLEPAVIGAMRDALSKALADG